MLVIFAGCKDACDDVDCNNNGVCSDGTCECVDGYDGTNCENEIRTSFFGDYEGPIDCGIIIGSSDASATITADPSGADQITIDLDIDILDITPVTATVTSADNFKINTNMQSVEINGQDVDVTITGDGVLQADNSISLELNTDPGFGVISCGAVLIRL